MRIYTRSGDLAFKTFTFPDGQPHLVLETYEREFDEVTIEIAIKSPCDLFTVLLAASVLRHHGYAQVNLDIRYLLGARMDRAIDFGQPFTLEVVSRLINGAGFTRVRILDVHSEVATRLIRNSTNVLPFNVVNQVFSTMFEEPSVIAPDKGAIDRTRALARGPIVQASKVRDPHTGELSGFSLDRTKVSPICLIIDDICDGGGTFVGLAKELRAHGAKKVALFVTHGIFSKGLPLEGIDKVFTTDSYYQEGTVLCGGHPPVVIPVRMQDLE